MRFHAVTTREQISGKINLSTPVVQKYVLEGINKWIGDCNGKNLSRYL